MHEFETTGPVTVAVRIAAGDVEVVAEERDRATVEVAPFDDRGASREAADRTQVEFAGDTLTVQAPRTDGWLPGRGGRLRVVVRVPLDSRLAVQVASADLRAVGRWAEAHVKSASGDVRVDHVTGAASITTASGDVHVDRVDGDAQAASASGDVRVGAVGGDLGFRSASGDLSVGTLAGSAHVQTASGDVDLGSTSSGEVGARSVSGDIRIGVTPGTGVWLNLSTLSGAARSELDVTSGAPTGAGAALNLQLRTVSGDIQVYRAVATTGAGAA